MAFFTPDQLEAIAGALGDTDAGLTGTEIQHLLASSKMTGPGPATKRVRIYNAFVESQNTEKNRTNILQFVRLAMKPARYSRQPERYEPMRALLNQALAFAGLVVDEAGNLTSTEAAQTLPEAQRRARDLRADLEGRGVQAAIVQSGACAFQHIDQVLVDLRRLDRAHRVDHFILVCPVDEGMDNLLGIANHGDVRAMRHHDNARFPF